MNSYPARRKQWFRVIAVGAVILTGLAGDQTVAAYATRQEAVDAADESVSRHCTFFHDIGGPPYVDETCAAAIRAVTQEAHGWPDLDSTSIAVRPNTISAVDVSDWPDFDSTSLGDKARVADAAPLSDYGHTANGRSIALIESKEAQVVIAEEQPLPDFALTPAGRSIILIESKEAPVEFSQSPNHPF